MNYYTDRAINNVEEDLLGRSSFSQQLGQAIYDYKGHDSLVIGLYGKWGTGKTSIVNMAFTIIEELSQNDDSKPIIARFAPWNYSDKDNLIGQFFDLLKAELRIQGNEKVKNKVGNALSEYSDVFDIASFVPVYGPFLAPALKTAVKAGGKKLSKIKDLNTVKTKLEKALLELNQKIIILIDDIDRLSNSQIRDIFQLVKQVGDLPNIIYVLAMDREVVKRALSEVHKFDGNEYLEKIIQIPFEIPEIRKTKLQDIFFHKLDSVIDDTAYNIEIEQDYWSRVYNNCIDPYIQTLRDINRVINTFQFRFSVLYQETSFEDMIGITTLEVLEPDLYKWIAGNKEAVCGGIMHGLLSNKRKPEEWRKQYSDEFIDLGLDPGKSIKSVAALFPVFAKDVDEHFYDSFNTTNIRGKMRVAQEDRFDLYFVLDLESVKVSRNVILDCIHVLEKSELKEVLKSINSQGNIVYFLEEMRSNIDKIPYERLGLLASAFLEVGDSFVGETERMIFSLPSSHLSSFCVEEMLKRLNTPEERFDVYRKVLLVANKYSIGSMAQEINRIEIAYGRLAGQTENKTEQIIDLEQLERLEQLFVERVNAINKNYDLFDIESFSLVFYLWKCFDKKGVQEYINIIFSNDISKLKFISKFAGRWRGTGGIGWSYNSNNYSEYISDEEIYELIQRCGKSRIDEFTESEQIKLASFVLNYKKADEYHVNEQKAKALVNEWENDNVDNI